MNKEKGIILKDGRLVTTFKELEGEYLKISADNEFIKMNFEYANSALRKANDDFIALENKLIDERKQYESKISELVTIVDWLKDMNKGLVELSLKIARGVIMMNKDEKNNGKDS